MYRAMVRLRRIDERMLKLQRQGRIGFHGSSSGQEAAAIGCAAALQPDDWVFPALREGGIALYRGFPLRLYMCHNFGNRDDLLKGRQMPCHFADRSVHFVSWSSCIATQLPQAVGAAYAMRRKGDSRIAVACLGDGASSEGDFHVAMNFAGVWKAPVVFFCQNNQWAISVPVSRQTASESIAVKAVAYGFRGVRVDGNDAVEVWRAVRDAAEAARAGKGPTMVEALTYRLGAHSSSDDPSRYRDETVTEEWRTRKDPIARLRATLETEGLWDDARETQWNAECAREIRSTLEEVESIPGPARETLFEDVYAEMPPHLREQEARFREEGSA
jgi:pyruvate dehydrogenase E1 component alpha subunit/2-oxoisovalerate dehydrogenase E1 component alpha subunit